MKLIILFFSFFCILGLADKIVGRWGLAEYVDEAVFSMSSTVLPYIGICCAGAVFVDKLTKILSMRQSYLPAVVIGSLLSPDLGAFKICQEIAPEKEWFFFCGLILSGCFGQFISFQLPIFSTTIKNSKNVLIQGFIAGIVAAPIGILTGGLVLGIPFTKMIFNCLPIWGICVLITFGFLKRPGQTKRILGLFGTFLQKLCVFLFAATIVLLQINPSIVLSNLADCMITFIKMLVIVIGGTILSVLIQKYLNTDFTMKVFHLDSVSFSGVLLNSISSIAMSPLWGQMSSRGKHINAAFAVSGAYIFGGQLTFAMAAEDNQVLLAYFTAKIIAGASGIIIVLLQDKFKHKKGSMMAAEVEH